MQKEKIFLGLILIIVISIVIMLFLKKNDEVTMEQTKNKVKMQLIETDVADYSKKNIKEYEIQVDDVIDLEEYYGNNIKVLEINDSNVKISRDAIKYKIISKANRMSKKYTETVIDIVDYDTPIRVNINESDPFGPVSARPRYEYDIKFIQ